MNRQSKVVTRFCPTPNGYLHHGNLYLALVNQEFARRQGGRYEVQIDDLYCPFPPAGVIDGISQDLAWLGICSPEQISCHSSNTAAYLDMVDRLVAEAKLRIRRTRTGCCVAKVEILQKEQVLSVNQVHASSCLAGKAGYIAFASDPGHLLDKRRVSLFNEADGWRHDTLWVSDPRDESAWLEFDLPAHSRPDTVKVICWHPQPQQLGVLARDSDAGWQRAGTGGFAATRPRFTRWGAFSPPQQLDSQLIPLAPSITASGVSSLRLCFGEIPEVESYELCPPEERELIHYWDLCLGERIAIRTQPRELFFEEFARAASDVILGTTHVIRGDELESELDLYVQCFRALGRPLPVLCHLPHLVDSCGDKLSKSLGNAPRIVEELRQRGLTPSQARAWLVEQAYRNLARPTRWAGFERQLTLLARSLGHGAKDEPAQRSCSLESGA